MATSVPDGIALDADGTPRCFWAGEDPLNRRYHDREWGRPVKDDRRLFEKLCLEGFQSGLSWLTILRKRDNFRRAFDGFDPAVVATYGDGDVDRLLADVGIVRHRGKILAAINNAKRYLELVSEFGTLGAYLWEFEPGPEARPARLDRETLMTLSASPESVALSKDLRRRGWAFVGPTTAYAAMQAMGLVNDHLEGCFARDEVERERASFDRPRR
jgi:DNA-3-methyladenine glycosylase I